MNKAYIIAADTDIGLTKSTNQDSLFMKAIYHPNYGNIVMTVICDGLGGLEKGEVASAGVVKAFAHWFTKTDPKVLIKVTDEQWIFNEFNCIIQEQNQVIGEFGKWNHTSLGTTVTAFLLVDDTYYIVHVGDTRVYELCDRIVQLTEDQTVVQSEVKKGLLSAEEAGLDPRRNILLQCVGASEAVTPQYVTGKVSQGSVYLFCTDGFRHELTQEELYQNLKHGHVHDKDGARTQIRRLIDLNKQRNEKDNITAALLFT